MAAAKPAPDGVEPRVSSKQRLFELNRKNGGSDAPTVTEYAEMLADESFIISDTVPFITFIAVAVCANLVVLAAETDLSCRGVHCSEDSNALWANTDMAFTFCFILDTGITMYSVGVSDYFKGDPLFYTGGFDTFNCFDFVLVMCRVIDLILSLAGMPNTGIKYFTAFRILHMGRFMKRVSSATFRELWLILGEMGGVVKAVGWVTLILLLFMWVFAILITIVVGRDVDAKEFNFKLSEWTKDDYWGTVPRSLFSLFQVITRDKWSDGLVAPLVERYNWLIIIFVPFLCIAVLALLNTIVGVVVESTLSSAQANEEKEGKEKRKLDAKIMKSLEEIFHEADTDGSGDLSREELHLALTKPIVRQRMKMLDIPLGDLDLLFTLLDEDDTGEIRTDMFFRGCSKLRGPAMSVDLHHLSVDLDHHIKWASEHIDKTTECNDLLQNLLDMVDNVDVDILRDEADMKDPVLMARRTRSTLQSKGTFLRHNKTVKFDTEPQHDKRQASKSLVKASIRAASKNEGSKQSNPDEMRKDSRKPSMRSVKSEGKKKHFQWPTD